MTLSVFVGYLLFLSFFDDPRKAFVSSLASIMFIGLFQFFYYNKFLKIKKFYVLKTEMLNIGFLLFIAVFQLSNSVLILGKESIDFNHILMRLFMASVFTFSLISLLVYIEIRKKTIAELKTQIFV